MKPYKWQPNDDRFSHVKWPPPGPDSSRVAGSITPYCLCQLELRKKRKYLPLTFYGNTQNKEEIL